LLYCGDYSEKYEYDELFIENKINLSVSEALMAEYYEVLRRPKFFAYYDFVARAELLLADIETRVSMYNPLISTDLILDKDDNKILELADVSAADYIITGNTNDFTFQKYKSTQIVNPRDYWLLYQISK